MSKYLEFMNSTMGHTHMQLQAALEIKALQQRNAELEGFYATYEREFKAVANWAISMNNDICEGKYENNTPEGMIYSESQWVDCRWQDITDPLFTSHDEALTKFAIEQQVKALEDLRSQLGCLDNREASLIANAINRRIEQLRKEQE